MKTTLVNLITLTTDRFLAIFTINWQERVFHWIHYGLILTTGKTNPLFTEVLLKGSQSLMMTVMVLFRFKIIMMVPNVITSLYTVYRFQCQLSAERRRYHPLRLFSMAFIHQERLRKLPECGLVTNGRLIKTQKQ